MTPCVVASADLSRQTLRFDGLAACIAEDSSYRVDLRDLVGEGKFALPPTSRIGADQSSAAFKSTAFLVS